MEYRDLTVGSTAQLELVVSERLVDDYARLTGDNNPVHLDEAFAVQSFFQRRVAHGLIGASLIGAVLGTKLPGPGSIYLSQTLQFKRPVYLGDTITAKVEVLEKRDLTQRVRLRTWVVNQTGQLVLDGSAEVLLK